MTAPRTSSQHPSLTMGPCLESEWPQQHAPVLSICASPWAPDWKVSGHSTTWQHSNSVSSAWKSGLPLAMCAAPNRPLGVGDRLRSASSATRCRSPPRSTRGCTCTHSCVHAHTWPGLQWEQGCPQKGTLYWLESEWAMWGRTGAAGATQWQKKSFKLPCTASNCCVLRECGQLPLQFYWACCATVLECVFGKHKSPGLLWVTG